MRQLTIVLALCATLQSFAQNQFTIPTVMPSVAKQTLSSSAGDVSMFILFEQFGEIPNEQKGGCTPTEVGTVKVKVEHYTAGGKFMFDQIMQSKRIDLDMKVAEEAWKEVQAQHAGNNASDKGTITKSNVPEGKALSFVHTTKCEDAGTYTQTASSFYVVTGTTIIYITLSHFGTAATLEKYAAEIVDKVKKIDFGKL